MQFNSLCGIVGEVHPRGEAPTPGIENLPPPRPAEKEASEDVRRNFPFANKRKNKEGHEAADV